MVWAGVEVEVEDSFEIKQCGGYNEHWLLPHYSLFPLPSFSCSCRKQVNQSFEFICLSYCKVHVMSFCLYGTVSQVYACASEGFS